MLGAEAFVSFDKKPVRLIGIVWRACPPARLPAYPPDGAVLSPGPARDAWP